MNKIEKFALVLMIGMSSYLPLDGKRADIALLVFLFAVLLFSATGMKKDNDNAN